MSRSFDRNIERLKANQRSVSQQEQTIRTNTAISRGQYEIAHARDIANKLSPFSAALQDWKDKDIIKKKEEGRAEYDKAQLDKAKWLEEHGSSTQQRLAKLEEAQKLGDLAFEIKDAEAQDREIQLLKKKLLDAQGVQGYPDAERLAQLSPWQQVGFVQQSIKNKKESFEDQLAHSMQNGTTDITLGGITYNAAEISGEKLAFSMKKHALNIYADKVYRNLGFDKYSKEMLKMAKVDETVSKAKSSLLTKYRSEYNIESSIRTRAKNRADWNSSPKGGVDMERFLLVEGNTINTKGAIVSHRGALDALMAQIVGEGVNNGGSTEDLDRYRDTPIPEGMRKRICAKPGATFGSHWKPRFDKARADIAKNHAAGLKQKLKNNEAAASEITLRFQAAAQEAYKNNRTLSTAEIAHWKSQYSTVGAKVPTEVTTYETASERNATADEKQIKALIAINGGITHDALNAFHPLAAAKFRKDADATEKAVFTEHGAEKRIKGALDDTFAHMGVKDKEKSMSYQIAFANAKQDYQKQYWEYVRMGIPEETAHHWALHGPSGKDAVNAEGQPMFQGRLGVAQEIVQNGENSKYTKAGLHIENTVGSDMVRVRYAMTAGKEMQSANQKGILLRKTKVIGGDYGQKQLDAIKENIQRYGLYRGIAMSKENIKYYKAIMASRNPREGGWWALIHDQLLVDDPSSTGLENNTAVKSVLPLLTGKVTTPEGEEKPIEDNDGVREVAMNGVVAAENKAPLLAYNYITDADNYYNNKSNGSVFDQPDQIPAHLGGIA